MEKRRRGDEKSNHKLVIFYRFIFVALTLSSCTRIPPQPPPRDYDGVYKYQRDACIKLQ